MFRTPESRNPKQLEFERLSPWKQRAAGAGCLVLGALMLMALLYFPVMTSPLFELASGSPLVNIHYSGFFFSGGLMGVAFLMGGIGILFHRRILVTEELKPFWRKLLYISFIGGFIAMFALGILLSLATWPLISSGGYSRCAEMSQGAKWNSYWALDQSLCLEGR